MRQSLHQKYYVFHKNQNVLFILVIKTHERKKNAIYLKKQEWVRTKHTQTIRYAGIRCENWNMNIVRFWRIPTLKKTTKARFTVSITQNTKNLTKRTHKTRRTRLVLRNRRVAENSDTAHTIH